MLDFTLSPEQLAIRDRAREFTIKEILPVAWYYDELDETPLTVLRKAFDEGLMNGDIPLKSTAGRGCGMVEGTIGWRRSLPDAQGSPHRYLIIPLGWRRSCSRTKNISRKDI